MTAKKFKIYAVKRGHSPGTYDSWDKCNLQITGFRNPVYKKCNSLEEAEAYLNDDQALASSTHICHLCNGIISNPLNLSCCIKCRESSFHNSCLFSKYLISEANKSCFLSSLKCFGCHFLDKTLDIPTATNSIDQFYDLDPIKNKISSLLVSHSNKLEQGENSSVCRNFPPVEESPALALENYSRDLISDNNSFGNSSECAPPIFTSSSSTTNYIETRNNDIYFLKESIKNLSNRLLIIESQKLVTTMNDGDLSKVAEPVLTNSDLYHISKTTQSNNDFYHLSKVSKTTQTNNEIHLSKFSKTTQTNYPLLLNNTSDNSLSKTNNVSNKFYKSKIYINSKLQKKFFTYCGGLSFSTTSVELCILLANKIKFVNDFKCFKLKIRSSNFASFCLVSDFPLLRKLLDIKSWPTNTIFKQFKGKFDVQLTSDSYSFSSTNFTDNDINKAVLIHKTLTNNDLSVNPTKNDLSTITTDHLALSNVSRSMTVVSGLHINDWNPNYQVTITDNPELTDFIPCLSYESNLQFTHTLEFSLLPQLPLSTLSSTIVKNFEDAISISSDNLVLHSSSESRANFINNDLNNRPTVLVHQTHTSFDLSINPANNELFSITSVHQALSNVSRSKSTDSVTHIHDWSPNYQATLTDTSESSEFISCLSYEDNLQCTPTLEFSLLPDSSQSALSCTIIKIFEDSITVSFGNFILCSISETRVITSNLPSRSLNSVSMVDPHSNTHSPVINSVLYSNPRSTSCLHNIPTDVCFSSFGRKINPVKKLSL